MSLKKCLLVKHHRIKRADDPAGKCRKKELTKEKKKGHGGGETIMGKGGRD